MKFFKNNNVKSLISKAQKQYDKAIDTLFESGSQSIRNSSTLASLYNKALYYCENALNLEPENITALNLKTSVLISQQHNDEAVKTIEKILTIDQYNINALFNKACILYETQNDIGGCKIILNQITGYTINSDSEDYVTYCDAKELLDALDHQ